jgi:UDP-3-O-[3-hydroxymyristoyl] glucosamine N-acyltransferase
MYKLKKMNVFASDIAHFLNLSLNGEDFILDEPFMIKTDDSKTAPVLRNKSEENILYIVSNQEFTKNARTFIISPNPKADIAMILTEFFSTPADQGIHSTAHVHSDTIIGRNVRIGTNSFIDSGVQLDDNVWIMNNVSIFGPVHIGKHSVIKTGAVIGSEGYNFVDDGHGRLIHPPQLGRIFIGENVWIGTNSTIERDMLKDAVIEDGVKIDDLVHIGKGAHIGKNCQITAGCIVAYDVTLGENVILGPNVSIRESVEIISNVIIGMGAAVINNIDKSGTYIGVPAKFYKKMKI